MAQSKAKTVAAYLEELPPDRRAVVSELRDLVRKHLPKGYEELMGFGMIMYSIPLKVLPDTYNGYPLCYVALAAQKNYYALYLLTIADGSEGMKRFQEAYKAAGKKLDMGKSCIRFKKLTDLPLDLIGKTIASVPMAKYVEFYKKSREKRA